jgi:hypothetical protein
MSPNTYNRKPEAWSKIAFRIAQGLCALNLPFPSSQSLLNLVLVWVGRSLDLAALGTPNWASRSMSISLRRRDVQPNRMRNCALEAIPGIRKSKDRPRSAKPLLSLANATQAQARSTENITVESVVCTRGSDTAPFRALPRTFSAGLDRGLPKAPSTILTDRGSTVFHLGHELP